MARHRIDVKHKGSTGEEHHQTTQATPWAARYNQEAIRKIRQPYSIDDDLDEQTFLTGLYDRPRGR